ncbi:hypothetical protein EVAR_76835_1 [Eumeta japonica]|uniref:Uncharacterized protein n=1 Tax=Eumeta variegata TaxID=151549 RepID=A0A4C1YYB0_EUMVA|nr:hypothetical protein EVAR_76835_1 [Eumeta japonica]
MRPAGLMLSTYASDTKLFWNSQITSYHPTWYLNLDAAGLCLTDPEFYKMAPIDYLLEAEVVRCGDVQRMCYTLKTVLKRTTASDVRIPRGILPSRIARTTVHEFCDASEAGYAAVIYLRTEADAAIKSAKTHLRWVIREEKLTFEELFTVYCKIEAALSLRPIIDNYGRGVGWIDAGDGGYLPSVVEFPFILRSEFASLMKSLFKGLADSNPLRALVRRPL